MSRIHRPEPRRAAAADWPCTAAWLALLALGGLSWSLGGLRGTPALVVLALAATLLKAQVVIDHYMGLRRVRGRWRALLAGWLLLVAVLVGAPLLIH
ncbi:cytochrome C oxidase subunit IV family protein [Thiomonas sp.]|jgi:hypothetical protein|uniref:cytochrome C oxidase subunit IV family protein n=1 Tax=Thiomonas sp. TaxID=2047785 RepID=UPI00260BD73C|nr:cytochrome C oxidase subunit IV family protein [Thiomonas sp.]